MDDIAEAKALISQIRLEKGIDENGFQNVNAEDLHHALEL